MPDENPASLGAFDMPLRFPGQYADKETNNNYNYFRDFDPTLGSYKQSDPIGLEGGLNTYSYVQSNPVISVDPLGLVNWHGTFGGISGGIGLGVGGFLFELTSECKCGYQITIYGAAVGGGFAAGIKTPRRTETGGSGGKQEFFDGNDCPDPDVATGFFSIGSAASVVVGGPAVSRIKLGKLRTPAPAEFPEKNVGLDVGVQALGGYSWTITANKRCCN